MVGKPRCQRQENKGTHKTGKEPTIQYGGIDRLKSHDILPVRKLSQCTRDGTGIAVKEACRQPSQRYRYDLNKWIKSHRFHFLNVPNPDFCAMSIAPGSHKIGVIRNVEIGRAHV